LPPTETSIPTETRTPTLTAAPSGSCNTGVVTINDDDSASPYPSTITLSGLGAWTSDVNVQLFGLAHSWPDDIDMLLVGPQGQRLVLLSDAGGDPIINNVNLTFDDSATQTLPDESKLFSETYRPTNYESTDSFPFPAPAPSGATNLATFNGSNPNGVWSLYIVDDEAYEDGILTGGWCLNVTASDTPPVSTPTATRTSTPVTQTFTSVAAQDGWILESSENGNTGGTLNATATTIQLGDDAANRQYRAILSFDTTSLPDGALIKSALLKIMQNGAPVGSNPFNALGSLWADIRQGPFSGNSALTLTDFNAAATTLKVGAFNKTPVGGWYTDTLNAAGLTKINKLGLTQLRLYFATDDNNNHLADYMKFFSGNNAANKPVLVITYVIP
jgi:subtilisin-like proprotein convertase family protein